MLTFLANFINSLERLIKEPPYLIFFFVSSIFVLTSLITRNNFESVWIFFLYSTGGTVWRYVKKDLETPLGNGLKIRLAYHIVNLALFIALLFFLKIL